MKEMGEGKLTDHAIKKKLMQYCGNAVRRNVNESVEQMRKEMLASFLHCSLSNEKPQRGLFPKTADSWCFYNRTKANN